MESHLLQMRGLKLAYAYRLRHLSGVASFTDAWIETYLCSVIKKQVMSHLLQMRGLKRRVVAIRM